MDRELGSVGTGARPDRSSWAYFACDEKAFAIPLDRIVEVVPPQPFTRLPGCSREVCGLVGLRGRLITVFDLGVLSGGAAAASVRDHRIILVRHGERVLGLVVETMVSSEDHEDGGGVDPASDVDPDSVTVAGRTFTVLDPDRLLGPLLD